jgi:hypothetical protein
VPKRVKIFTGQVNDPGLIMVNSCREAVELWLSPMEKMDNNLEPQKAKIYPTNVKDFRGNTE